MIYCWQDDFGGVAVIAWVESYGKQRGEVLLIPQEKSVKQGRPYNRTPGSWLKDERMAERLVVLMIPKQQNFGGGKGPNC